MTTLIKLFLNSLIEDLLFFNCDFFWGGKKGYSVSLCMKCKAELSCRNFTGCNCRTGTKIHQNGRPVLSGIVF